MLLDGLWHHCAATFDGARPDGPGSGYECRYLQTFYDNTEWVAASIGICVDPGEWGGSCADFDYDQLAADIADGTAPSDPEASPEWESYCTNHPDRCRINCVSLTTIEALFASAPFTPPGNPGGPRPCRSCRGTSARAGPRQGFGAGSGLPGMGIFTKKKREALLCD